MLSNFIWFTLKIHTLCICVRKQAQRSCMLGNFACNFGVRGEVGAGGGVMFSSFPELTFSKVFIINTIRVSNHWNKDQARRPDSTPDLDPNFL